MSKRSNSIGYTYCNNDDAFSTDCLKAVLCSCDAAKYQAELIQLRQSTEAALQKSWDEVEAIQAQCSEHCERIHELEHQLKSYEKEKQEALSSVSKMEKELNLIHQKRVRKMNRVSSVGSLLALSQTSQRATVRGEDIGRSEHSFLSSYSKVLSPFRTVEALLPMQADHNSTTQSRPSSPDDSSVTNVSDSSGENDYKKLYHSLMSKLHSRDKAILSLESALDLNRKIIQDMSNELQTLKVKEKRNSV